MEVCRRGSAAHLRRQRRGGLGTGHGGQVHQPRWRIGLQECTEAVAIDTSTESPQGFKYLQIGFPRPIVVEALPVPMPEVCCRPEVCDKRLHHSGLANARLARQEYHLPLTLLGALPAVL